MIDISKLSRVDVLAALYNNSKPLGKSILQYEPRPMTKTEAQELLDHGTSFDYLKGRVMKVNLSSKEEFNEFAYDRDNGAGAAQSVVNKLLTEDSPYHANEAATALQVKLSTN